MTGARVIPGKVGWRFIRHLIDDEYGCHGRQEVGGRFGLPLGVMGSWRERTRDLLNSQALSQQSYNPMSKEDGKLAQRFRHCPYNSLDIAYPAAFSPPSRRVKLVDAGTQIPPRRHVGRYRPPHQIISRGIWHRRF